MERKRVIAVAKLTLSLGAVVAMWAMSQLNIQTTLTQDAEGNLTSASSSYQDMVPPDGSTCICCQKPVEIGHFQENKSRMIWFCSRCFMKQTPATFKEF